jgi:hypothetical protein
VATDKVYAKKLLERLVELDYQTVEAYYDMGSIISSMQHGKLFDLLDYRHMSELIENELTFSAATGNKYASMYRHFRRLHYLKHEATDLLKKFGLTHMCDVLPGITDKIGSRAIKNRIDAIDQHQINFTLNGAQLDECHKALAKLGAEQSDGGRYLNSSEAFMNMVDMALANGTVKPKLVAVN